MRVELRLGGLIEIAGRDIALGQSYALLDGIARCRSVRGAAEALDVSYRSAWDRIRRLEEVVGRPVVAKTKGHGSALTELGAALRDALGTPLHHFETGLREEARALEERLAGLLGASGAKVRLAASHDPLLMGVLARRPEIEVTVAGSTDAVARLRAGTADAAGFHAGVVDASREGPFSDLFADPAFVVHPLFAREQGLMVAAGNPLGIGSVADLAGGRVRFVNRQKGSGTRLWFDRLLAGARIKPADVAGAEIEEFTHQAVAAVIASGAADAGMGARAVAERFGLAFVPVGWETYYLVTAAAEDGPRMAGCIEAVRSAIGTAPGYRKR